VTTEAPETYDWRHGWIPLTMRAALQKTHGNHEAAERLLEERRRRRRSFVSPHPKHQREHAERQRWAGLSDDELSDAMGTAGEEELDRIVRELDRRDRAQRKSERARERRHERRTAEERRRSADFDAACDAGEDPEEAYARVYGVSEEKVRRQAAEESLRSAGYAGRDFRSMVKTAHAEDVRERYLHAEDVCRGHMLNAAGRAAGIDSESLFSGPASRAKKYASEELADYFREHGRLTVEDFTAGLLGGHARHRTTGDEW
jgi:hypothetical protein